MGPLESTLYPILLAAGFVVAAGVFFTLFFVSAPYGRHVRKGWGPSVNSTAGWILMELPAVLTIAGCFLWGNGWVWTPACVFLLLWELHYLHRTFIFPFRLRNPGRKTPVMIIGFAIVFNGYNGYMNGRYLGTAEYTPDWFTSLPFLLGTALFFVGLAINIHADQVLINLRRGATGYAIPRGGLYRWISCPNYFGELLEWTGWAMATWSMPGLLFAVWTAANLAPRARTHHQWYHAEFPEYPRERKALLPLLW